MLFAINLVNFFDRQIIGGVGEGIRREWGLSDTSLGLLGTVFTLLYAVFGLPLGRLSDRTDRRRLLTGGVFVWSLLTFASGMASTFSQLVAARLGVGIGEATCSPASSSLLGDFFPTTARARAVAIWMLGLPIGLGLANGDESEGLIFREAVGNFCGGLEGATKIGKRSLSGGNFQERVTFVEAGEVAIGVG